jgi:hypothetical protein
MRVKDHLVSVRFAFPSKDPEQRFEKWRADNNDVAPYTLLRNRPSGWCLVNGAPSWLRQTLQMRSRGKHGGAIRILLIGKCIFTGQEQKQYGGPEVYHPRVLAEKGDFNAGPKQESEFWKRKHEKELLPPDLNHFVIETVCQSSTQRYREIWNIPFRVFCWSSGRESPNPFLKTALAMVRSQDVHRFYYFLCAVSTNSTNNLACQMIGNGMYEGVLKHIFDFACGAKPTDVVWNWPTK